MFYAIIAIFFVTFVRMQFDETHIGEQHNPELKLYQYEDKVQKELLKEE